MSKADELIAGLQTDAQFDSEGSFSLDREKARQKMRQFQLADPHRYVLLLVEAAALKGARTIEFEIDADDMHMRFDAALDWEDLDELYTSLFVDRTSVAIRARRELALACNAVMALNPRWVRLESWARGADGAPTGVRGLLRPEEDDLIERIEQPPEQIEAPWTSVHVKERFRPGLLVRFLHDLAEALPEEELIRTRCSMSSLTITLDGSPVSHGLPRWLVAGVEFEAEGLRGVAGINPAQPERSTMVLLSNGVELVRTQLNDSVPGLEFWIDASNLRKDVSQADVVRSDVSYRRMLTELGRPRDRVLARLVELWAAGEFNDHSELDADAVFDLLRRCFLRWADHDWLAADAGPLGKLADLPLWRTVERGWISPRALAAAADPRRGLMYTSRDYDGVQPLGWGPIIHAIDGEHELEAIRRVYPLARDVDEELDREVPWERNRRRWRARVHPPELPRGVASGAIDFGTGTGAGTNAEAIRGQAVMRPGRASEVRIVVDGSLLCELEIDLGALGISAVLTGPFTPIADYSRARHDRALASGALLLLAQLPRLIAAWVGTWSEHEGGQRARDELRRCLIVLARLDFARRWVRSFGFSESAARQMVGRIGAPALLPEFGLEAGSPTAVAEALRFTTVDLRGPSLAELDAIRRERGKLLVVDSHAPTSSATEELMLHVDVDQRVLLTAIFGGAALQDETESYVRGVTRREYLRRPIVRPSLTLNWKVAVERRSAGESADEPVIWGLVGVNAPVLRGWKAGEARKAEVELIVEQRRLTVVEERAWLPGVQASLVWERAPINRTWDGIAGELDPVRDAVNAGLLALLEAQARQAIEAGVRPNHDLRRLLWLAMAAPFVSTEHAAAWRRLRAGLEHEAAVERYFELMLLFPAVPLSDLREAITLLLEDDRLPTREAVLGIVDRDIDPRPGGREFQRGVLDRYALLEQVPLLETVADRHISLAALERHFAATGEIAHVEGPSLHFESDEYLILRSDPIDHVALIRLFGREAFHEVSAWIHERGHQQRFETQAQIEHIRVEDHNRLVGVEFEREGIRGELVIPPWMPGEAGVMTLTFCHDRRVVQKLELHAQLPVLGILDDPEAELSGDYSSVMTGGARMAVVRKLLDELLEAELLPALAAAYPGLGFRERGLARGWIAAHWRRASPRAGSYPNRLGAAGRAFAGLPLFEDVDGTPRSLASLSERYRDQRKLWYVDEHPGYSVAPPFPILLRRPHERELLDDLFSEVEDFSPRWRAWVGGAQRRERARDLPPREAPSAALVTTEVERHELEGALWLPDRVPFDPGLILGAEGKVLTVLDPVELLPAQGVVDGVEADDGFKAAQLSGAQRRFLDTRVIGLYSKLLERHRRDLRRPDRADFLEPEPVRLRSLRIELLRNAAVNLARARRRGQSFDAILGNLDRRLADEPLLRLTSGRLISVELARQARPQELAHLDIWDPDDPGLSLSERARLLLGEAGESEPRSESGAGPESEPQVEPSEPRPAANVEREPEELDEAELLALVGELEFVEDQPPAEPAVPIRDHVGELLERIREELRLLRECHGIYLSEGQLDCITADRGNGRELVRIEDGVLFDSTHPCFVRALEDPDPIWSSFLTSVAYTALNRWLEEVTDSHELVFHHRHAEHLLSGLVDG